YFFFFFSSRRRHTRWPRDWSSDVCSFRSMIFQKGFFRIRDLRICAEPVPLDLHVPYWIGFYDAGKSVRLRVLDAVRRRFEGAKRSEERRVGKEGTSGWEGRDVYEEMCSMG